MNDVGNLPHIYHTIFELSLVNDVTVMKNLNVKTLGYIHEDQAYELNLKNSTFERGSRFVKLDLTHIEGTFSEFKPCIIYGTLFSLNQCPMISVKTLRQFDEDFENLVIYHNQSLAIRARSPHFEDLESLFKETDLEIIEQEEANMEKFKVVSYKSNNTDGTILFERAYKPTKQNCLLNFSGRRHHKK